MASSNVVKGESTNDAYHALLNNTRGLGGMMGSGSAFSHPAHAQQHRNGAFKDRAALATELGCACPGSGGGDSVLGKLVGGGASGGAAAKKRSLEEALGEVREEFQAKLRKANGDPEAEAVGEPV